MIELIKLTFIRAPVTSAVYRSLLVFANPALWVVRRVMSGTGRSKVGRSLAVLRLTKATAFTLAAISFSPQSWLNGLTRY